MFFIFTYLIYNRVTYFIEWSLGGSFHLFTLRFMIDYISALFLCVVFFISSNVVSYRRSYIFNDKDADRFILLVLSFVISIVFLIVRPNMVTILLGWDGLGLTSYALVIYYPTKKSNRAGMLTVISNRVGDVCILLAISWFRVVGDYNFCIWINDGKYFNDFWLPLLIVLAAITKRAQIPFSAWLPAAMAAPTPVSALVHSSTLVTAGVYLLIRFGSFTVGFISIFLFFVSVITMFISGLVAVYEYDLKKVIALSTLSQLGVIMFSISLGLYTVAFFHLIIHALFKAILFLCAGAIIHGVGGSQDIRHYGGQIYSYPVIASCLNIANLSLCGIPFISGFYSKDLIVELAAQGIWNQFLILIMFISLGFTVIYRVRIVYISLVGFPIGIRCRIICDLDWVIVGPIVLLSIISLISGSIFRWIIFSIPSLVLLPWILKIGALIIIITSVLLAYSFTIREWGSYSINKIISFNGIMWFFPLLSGQYTRGNTVGIGIKTIKYLDHGWLEVLRLNLIGSVINLLSSLGVYIQANRLKNHFLVLVFWLILLIVYN